MKNILIDLEFTGLDNTYVADNEIIQLKLMDADCGNGTCINFKANKPVSLYHQAYYGLEGEYVGESLFSAAAFVKALERIGVMPADERQYFGYSVSTDIAMLKKYGVEVAIGDLQERIRLNSNYERELAVGCASLECAYLLLTAKNPPLDTHLSLVELDLVREIYRQVMTYTACNELLTLMPHGHCAGMLIGQFVRDYRRWADGYRHNNSDLLARSLTAAIPAYSCRPDDEDDEDFDDEDDEDFDNEDDEDFDDDDDDDDQH